MNETTAEIPEFKLAKVGAGRKRRRGGGVGWWGARGSSSGLGGLGGFGAGAGGAGLGGFLGTGMSLAKAALVLTMVGGLSVGAWLVGSRGTGRVAAKGSASRPFADKGTAKYDDLSGVIKSDKSMPNSLGYVSGSLDGLTPEERAKKQAEEEAGRKAADEDARKQAKADVAKQAANAAAPAVPEAVVPSAADGKHLAAGKFGELAKNFGGGSGLSGGAGLSGGINRGFGESASPFGRGLKAPGAPGKDGELGKFYKASKASIAKTPHTAGGKSNARGFAKRQLDNSFSLSRQAGAASKTETSAAAAAAAFDNNAGQGNVISGPGVGGGAKSTSGGDTSPNDMTGGGGGPINNNNSGVTGCPDGQAPDANGMCQNVATSGAKNAAPYQGLIDAVMAMLAIVAILSMVLLYLAASPDPFASKSAIIMIKNVIGGLGALIGLMGIAIMAMSGDIMIGGIVTAVGAFVAYTAFSADISSSSISTQAMIKLAAGSIIASAVGMLASASKVHML